jgi:predicted glycoside hydrolase/deacetylase ChbG (UPF0249 family)
MKQVIINADDFGINESVTSEIERMIQVGLVSSTTVMANGSCLEEVRKFASQHPEISFGAHLCLSEFESVTKSEELCRAGLTDETGAFVHKAVFSIKNLNDEGVRHAIREELNAQIDIVGSLGFQISHADSHHHVHTIPCLREVFASVIKERHITRIRLGNDFRSLKMRRHVILWLQRERLNKFYRSQFITTDAFYSYAEFFKYGMQKKEKVVELMCHPGHPGQQYRDEVKLLEEGFSKNNCELKLINYNDLY